MPFRLTLLAPTTFGSVCNGWLSALVFDHSEVLHLTIPLYATKVVLQTPK
ncbi:uncharacterized protein METZ01_LOCUS282583 [marine metagenome]|uniref:Uncharacterized protein n=1 Tax=marine metagenome TaxID=408172 RepID=A0A382KZH2_9ZZZZ